MLCLLTHLGSISQLVLLELRFPIRERERWMGLAQLNTENERARTAQCCTSVREFMRWPPESEAGGEMRARMRVLDEEECTAIADWALKVQPAKSCFVASREGLSPATVSPLRKQGGISRSSRKWVCAGFCCCVLFCFVGVIFAKESSCCCCRSMPRQICDVMGRYLREGIRGCYCKRDGGISNSINRFYTASSSSFSSSFARSVTVC